MSVAVIAKGECDDGKVALKWGDETQLLPEETRGAGRVHSSWPEELAEGWHTIEAPSFFLYGGGMPFVAKDVGLPRSRTRASRIRVLTEQPR